MPILTGKSTLCRVVAMGVVETCVERDNVISDDLVFL